MNELSGRMGRLWARPWRMILAVLVITTVIVQGVLLADVAFWREPRSLTIGLVRVASPAWPSSAAPIRVLLLSDFHVDDTHMRPERIARIVQTANALSPDLTLLAGDYVGGLVPQSDRRLGRAIRKSPTQAQVEAAVRALGGLRARYGVVAILGNHDVDWDAARMTTLLRQAGLTVLRNGNQRIVRPGGDVWIEGLGDLQEEKVDFAAAASGVPKGAAVIALGHNPYLFDWKGGGGMAILLAGHTHGGQVRFPWIGSPFKRNWVRRQDTFTGPVTGDGRVLVVTRGLGESGLPVRFGSPPEMLMVEIGHGEVLHAERIS